MMKTFKFFILLSFFLNTPKLFAQVVSTKEIFPNGDTTITLIFDVKLATDSRAAGLLGKTSDVYLWSGAGITTNTNDAFTFQPAGQSNFGLPFVPGKMTSLGNDKWSISFKPRDYFGVPVGNLINELGLLLKSGDGKFQTENFYLTLYDPSVLHVSIVQPKAKFLIVEKNTTLPVLVRSSKKERLQTAAFWSGCRNGPCTSFGGNPPQPEDSLYLSNILPMGNFTGNLAFYVGNNIIKKVNNDPITTDSLEVYVKKETPIVAMPSGIKDGINYVNDTTVILSLYAPKKQYVYVIGEFNNGQVDDNFLMNRTPDSSRYWLQINNLVKGKEYVYQYLVDGTIAVGDPYCEKTIDPNYDQYIPSTTYPNLKAYPTVNTYPGQIYPITVNHYNGVVSVLQTGQPPYNWQTKNYQPPTDKNLVVYELLVRDFVASKKYKDVADSLGYLKKMGINAIELMPFTEFTGNDSWGYNPIYYTAPDKAYGTKEDLKYLIDKAHSLGISVIQDIVFNQADNECPYVKMYWDGSKPSADSPFFNQQATHPYSVFNDFNHESTATQTFVDNVCQFWLTNYKIDGFRFDLSKGFTQNITTNDAAFAAYDALRVKNLKRIYDKIRTYNKAAYLILEHFAVNQEETELSNYGFMLWGNFNGAYTNVLEGNSADFTGVYHGNVGWNSPHRVAYMESHDEERLIFNATQNSVNSTFKQLSTALDREKLATAFFLTIPGPKMVWQFGEMGYDISINQNGRTGAKPLHWEYLQDANRSKLFKTYQALLTLRNSVSGFNDAQSTIENTNTNFKRIVTSTSNEKIFVVGNFGTSQISQQLKYPQTGIWYDYFTGKQLTIIDVNEAALLQVGEFHVLTTKQYPTPEPNLLPWVYTKDLILGTENADNQMITIFPNPTEDKVYVKMPPLPATEVSLENLTGKMLMQYITDKAIQDIDLTGLPAGIYFVRVKQGDVIKAKKIVKE